MADNHSILVGTLGMFILDSFKYTCDYSSTHIPALVPGEWYIGGGGTYATVGARMWLPPERIAMVIHPGHDFPRKITDQLEGYSRTLFTFLSDPTHPETTRALNTYTNERREFEYLTTKRQVRLDELYSAKSVPPRYVRVICSPMRLLQIMQEREARFPGWQVQWIWEPVPESCTPSNLSKVQECVNKSMVVFSPNDLEASELLGRPSAPSSAEAIEAIADHFHCMGFPAVVIRSGKRGAFVIGAPLGSQSLQRFWVPPLIQDQSLVVDQTGAGNAFLGGMMAGLARGESLVDAACCGSVSSGLTITQLGLPQLSSPCPQQLASEIWNHDCSPQQLLLQMRSNVSFVTQSV